MELKRGANLGGWLSQCCHKAEHYETFIQEDDLKRISEWGFDHVRVPVDYEVLEDQDANIIEVGYEYVKKLIGWCQKYNLNAVLDLHKAYGYDFNDAGNDEKNTLFAKGDLQDRFVQLWIRMANAFGTYENVAFELLNEVVEMKNADAWNELIDRTVTEIRKVTTTAPIIYGGIQWNSIKTLKLLAPPRDENIIFTFHLYEPFVFTHQNAWWVEKMVKDKEVYYPETREYYTEMSTVLGYQAEVVTKETSEVVGANFIRDMIQEAIDVAEKAGVKLYCGEFGVIDQAPIQDTLRWFKDVNEVFEENHIGWSLWTYKEMDFGLVDEHYDAIREDLISLWFDKDK